MTTPAETGADIANAISVWDVIRTWGTPGMALAALAGAFKVGKDYASLRSDLDANDKATSVLATNVSALAAWQDNMGRDHASLRVAVAALPTRAEMNDGFNSVRLDIRDIPRQTKE